MKNKTKLYYLLISIAIILSLIGIFNNLRTQRIVKVLNHYNEINKIVIIKDENKHEISEDNLAKYKNALEPRNIINKKNGKEITKKLEDKIIDIEYYISDQKLLESSIYSLSDKPNGDFEHYSFEIDGKPYTMVVNKEFRSVNKMDRRFLLEYLQQ